MASSMQSSIWDNALELTKAAQEKGTDPLLWSIQLSSGLSSAGVCFPSAELAELLISHICWENNVPLAWKFLEKALMLKIVPRMLVLALLSIRVIPNRYSHPEAFRLYMELVKRHAFSLKSSLEGQSHHKVMNLIDAILRLTQIFGLKASGPDILVVEFIFMIVWQLLDSSLDDEGLMDLTPEKKSLWEIKLQHMEVDLYYSCNQQNITHQEKMRNINTLMAIDLVGLFLQNKLTSRVLCLARQNLPTYWGSFLLRIEILAAHSSVLKQSQFTTAQALLQLATETKKLTSRECKTSVFEELAVTASGPLAASAGLCHGVSRSSLWLTLDLVLEDAMDSYQVSATSAIDIITGLLKVLQAINGTTWHDTFLGLWMAALRFVQRERDPIEGPVPHLDTRLSMLLSITTLVIAELIEEEENEPNDLNEVTANNHITGKCRRDLVSSLQILGDYKSLLIPPESVVSAANQAAMKAMVFVSGISVGNEYFESISMKDMPITCSGNLHHLIIEACIARNLLDTSAYFWPGYVNGHINQIPQVSPQMPSWSSFMNGAPLSPLMINALASTPASSQA